MVSYQNKYQPSSNNIIMVAQAQNMRNILNVHKRIG